MPEITLTFTAELNTSLQAGDTVCEIVGTAAIPGADDFYLFSKDNKFNMASPLGYYAKARFENNSTIKSEIFTVACDIFESSK